MNFYCKTVIMRFKILWNAPFLLVNVLLCVFLVAVSLFMDKAGFESLQIGILYDEEDLVSRQIVQFVYDHSEFSVQAYTEESLLQRDVATESLLAGYKIQPGIQEGAYESCIWAYHNSGNTVSGIADELMAAAVLQSMSGNLGVQVLSDYMPTDTFAEMKETILQDAYHYTANGPMLPVEFISIGSIAGQEDSYFNRTASGLIGLFAMLLILFCGASFVTEKNTGLFQRIHASGANQFIYHLGNITAIFLSGFLFAIFTGLLLSALSTYSFFSASSLLLLFFYGICIAAMAFFLSICFLKETGYIAACVFLFLFTALLGGVFFQVQEIMQTFTWVQQIFPIYYYLNGLTKPMPVFEIFILFCISAILLIFGGLVLKNKKKL